MKTKEGAKKYVEQLKPETTGEARGYFYAYWHQEDTDRLKIRAGLKRVKRDYGKAFIKLGDKNLCQT